MRRPTASRADGLDALLDGLPTEYAAVPVGHERAVVGPTGVFLVGGAGEGSRAAAERLGRLAERCRLLLARTVATPPFVEPLVVAERGGETSPLASVVPSRMLADTLLSGPPLLGADVRARLVAALRLVAPELAAPRPD